MGTGRVQASKASSRARSTACLLLEDRSCGRIAHAGARWEGLSAHYPPAIRLLPAYYAIRLWRRMAEVEKECDMAHTLAPSRLDAPRCITAGGATCGASLLAAGEKSEERTLGFVSFSDLLITKFAFFTKGTAHRALQYTYGNFQPSWGWLGMGGR